MRYRLDDLVELDNFPLPLRWLCRILPRGGAQIARLPRGERMVLALTELGPIFVKFGQILSTRRDLLPPDIADALTALQDNVAPFPGSVARLAVEAALDGSCRGQIFASFDVLLLASASIAPQVHAAQLPSGREVVVKVLRPDIHERVARDVELLRALGRLAQRMHPNADKISATRYRRRDRDDPGSMNSTCSARVPMRACCGAISSARLICTFPK